MPRAYSLDLRTRIVGYVDAGHSRHAAAAHFGVSASFVVNLLRAWRETGRLGPRPAGGRRHSKLDPHSAFLLERVAEREDITMPELSAELSAKGTTVDPTSISRWFIRNGYRFKKNAVGQRTRSAGRSQGAGKLGRKAPAQHGP